MLPEFLFPFEILLFDLHQILLFDLHQIPSPNPFTKSPFPHVIINEHSLISRINKTSGVALGWACGLQDGPTSGVTLGSAGGLQGGPPSGASGLLGGPTLGVTLGWPCGLQGGLTSRLTLGSVGGPTSRAVSPFLNVFCRYVDKRALLVRIWAGMVWVKCQLSGGKNIHVMSIGNDDFAEFDTSGGNILHHSADSVARTFTMAGSEEAVFTRHFLLQQIIKCTTSFVLIRTAITELNMFQYRHFPSFFKELV